MAGLYSHRGIPGAECTCIFPARLCLIIDNGVQPRVFSTSKKKKKLHWAAPHPAHTCTVLAAAAASVQSFKKNALPQLDLLECAARFDVHTRLLLCSLTMRQGIFHWLEVMDTCFKAPNSNYPAYSCIIRLRSHGGMSRGPDISWQRPSSSGSILFAFCHVSRAIATKWKRLGADKPGYTN